jgi:propanol-preferring alcohol dehydrogenase
LLSCSDAYGGRFPASPDIANNADILSIPGDNASLTMERKNKMPKNMMAAVVREFGKPLVIQEVAIPEPGPEEIQIKVEACGVCHTDLHAAEGDWPIKPTPPFIPGHEGVGYVSGVGRNVKTVKEGDRAGIVWLYSACGQCVDCLAGQESCCAKAQFGGYTKNGGYAEYAVADPNYVAHLPANVGFVEVAPIICAGVTVYKGLKSTNAKPGDWVVISGIGGLGHLAVQYAKAMGFHVAAVDVSEDKLALARRLGAKLTVNAKEQDPAAFFQKEIGGANAVLVTAVSTHAFAQAIGMTRARGTIALNGLPPGSFPLPIFEVVLKALTIRGSIVGTRLDLAEALSFAGEGLVHATTKAEKLEDINDIFKRMHAGTIDGRIVLDITGKNSAKTAKEENVAVLV